MKGLLALALLATLVACSNDSRLCAQGHYENQKLVCDRYATQQEQEEQ